MAFILRNILYVNENEMKIGLETTLSFLWKVPSSDFPLVCHSSGVLLMLENTSLSG